MRIVDFIDLRTYPNLSRWNYPGGEVGVRMTAMPRRIIWRIQQSSDLVALIMACRCDTFPQSILIPYMPYARQDRIATLGDPLAIEVFARLIAATGASEVCAIDAHSAITSEAFNGVGIKYEDISPIPFIKRFMSSIGNKDFVFISPDKGAKHKTIKYAYELGVSQTIICDKQRDPKSGKLTGFAVSSAADCMVNPSQTFMIVDDICDGGRTFIGVKNAVIAAYPKLKDSRFVLWTSHGIYSQGIDVLAKEFSIIGSTDSFLHGLSHSALVTIPLQ